jgi:hypothetical protein
LSELLSEQRSATRENVERKQAQTEAEREESDEEQSEEEGNQVTWVRFYTCNCGKNLNGHI